MIAGQRRRPQLALNSPLCRTNGAVRLRSGIVSCVGERIWTGLFVAAAQRMCRTLCVAAFAEHYIQPQSFERLF